MQHRKWILYFVFNLYIYIYMFLIACTYEHSYYRTYIFANKVNDYFTYLQNYYFPSSVFKF